MKQVASLLVGLLGGGSPERQDRAVRSLWQMVRENPVSKLTIAKAGGAEPLVILLRNGGSAAKECARSVTPLNKSHLASAWRPITAAVAAFLVLQVCPLVALARHRRYQLCYSSRGRGHRTARRLPHLQRYSHDGAGRLSARAARKAWRRVAVRHRKSGWHRAPHCDARRRPSQRIGGRTGVRGGMPRRTCPRSRQQGGHRRAHTPGTGTRTRTRSQILAKAAQNVLC